STPGAPTSYIVALPAHDERAPARRLPAPPLSPPFLSAEITARRGGASDRRRSLGDRMVSPALIERARRLRVAALGQGRYRVTGGRHPHVVDCTGASPICDCADHQYRGRACKHITAVDAAIAAG